MRLWERLLVVAALLFVVCIIGVGLGGERTAPMEGRAAASLVANTPAGPSLAKEPPEICDGATTVAVPWAAAAAQDERARYAMLGDQGGGAMHDAPAAPIMDRQIVAVSGNATRQAARDHADLTGGDGGVAGVGGEPWRFHREDRPVLAGAVS
ncbi:MAG: hypothetical protein U1E14_01115 [Geminicoccaceae bacterium]